MHEAFERKLQSGELLLLTEDELSVLTLHQLSAILQLQS